VYIPENIPPFRRDTEDDILNDDKVPPFAIILLLLHRCLLSLLYFCTLLLEVLFAVCVVVEHGVHSTLRLTLGGFSVLLFSASNIPPM